MSELDEAIREHRRRNLDVAVAGVFEGLRRAAAKSTNTTSKRFAKTAVFADLFARSHRILSDLAGRDIAVSHLGTRKRNRVLVDELEAAFKAAIRENDGHYAEPASPGQNPVE